MMLNVRGSHGSGKTTISHRLLDEHPHEERIEPARLEGVIRSGKKLGESYAKNFKKPNAFVFEGGLTLVGRRQAGLDGYLPHETIEDSIEYWAARSEHLIFENVLLSGNIGRWGELFQRLEPINHTVLAHLDTHWALSQERILARRAEARALGFSHRQTDEELARNLPQRFTHWKRCRRVATRATLAGFDVRWLDHRYAYEMAHDALVEAGWRCPVHYGPLLPDGPFLSRWDATEVAEGIIKTARLPWEEPWETPVFTRPKHAAAATPVAVVQPAAASGTINGDPLDQIGDPFDC